MFEVMFLQPCGVSLTANFATIHGIFNMFIDSSYLRLFEEAGAGYYETLGRGESGLKCRVRRPRRTMWRVAALSLAASQSSQTFRTQSGRVLLASFSQLPTDSCT